MATEQKLSLDPSTSYEHSHHEVQYYGDSSVPGNMKSLMKGSGRLHTILHLCTIMSVWKTPWHRQCWNHRAGWQTKVKEVSIACMGQGGRRAAIGVIGLQASNSSTYWAQPKGECKIVTETKPMWLHHGKHVGGMGDCPPCPPSKISGTHHHHHQPQSGSFVYTVSAVLTSVVWVSWYIQMSVKLTTALVRLPSHDTFAFWPSAFHPPPDPEPSVTSGGVSGMTHSRSQLQGYYGKLILRHFISHSGKGAQEDTGSGLWARSEPRPFLRANYNLGDSSGLRWRWRKAGGGRLVRIHSSV